MNCPDCHVKLQFRGWQLDEFDNLWKCPRCRKIWPHAVLQDLKYNRRANEPIRWTGLDAEKEIEK